MIEMINMKNLKKAVILLTLFLFAAASALYARNTREEIAENVIRLHILANSDSVEDQQLKIKIRDSILEKYRSELSSSDNIAKTRALIYENMSDIKKTAENTAKANGFDYTVNVYLAKDFFPTKKYADVTLPAGKYEALRIEIGKAGGKNWWCVMFPPLCYADTYESDAAVKSKARLEQLLSGECYCLMTKNSPDVKVRLKIVEMWSTLKEKL
ncbi:MAG: stage II sporulation protein R [Firmicutes bacterium]|nr:stage II sporulation protein R [Bacillota bacterium]